MRLDRLFKIELNDIGKFAETQTGSHNPKEVMQKVMMNEIAGRQFRFEGIKAAIEKSTVSSKQKNKGENKGGKQAV